MTFEVVLALTAGVVVLPADFPEPDGLAPNVRFWERVYSEWRSDQVVFHDTAQLDVVYRVVDLGELRVFPKPEDRAVWLSQVRARRAFIGEQQAEVVTALQRLRKKQARKGFDPESLEGLDREIYEALAAADALDRLAGAPERIRWQYGLADRFAGGLTRFDAYRETVTAIFEAEGLPADLVALGFVESLFDPYARSHVGALGVFQFMPATGAELGLGRSTVHDERRDPLRAAEAAARMLRQNYRRLGNWPLALTAYNHGPNGVARAVREVGSDDLMDLIRRYDSSTWGFASRNFYSEFLAARRVLSRRAELFGPWVPAPPVSAHPVQLPAAVTLAELEAAECVESPTVPRLNPALLDAAYEKRARLPRGLRFYVPAGIEVAAFVACAASAALGGGAPMASSETRPYLVRPGDTLSHIGRRLGVAVHTLRRLNGLGSDGRIFAGQTLRVPARAATPAP